jgi:hypothetical protein
MAGRGGATAVLDAPAATGDDRVDDEADLRADDTLDIPVPRVHDEDMPEELPGRIVRSKVHPAEPMSVDDALSRMELVGHDFYLFSEAESGQPCVVYRRKGYDYGMIRLEQ